MPPSRGTCQSSGVLLCRLRLVPPSAGAAIAVSARSRAWAAVGGGAAGCAAFARRPVPHRLRRRLAGTMGTLVACPRNAGAGQGSGALAVQRPRAGGAGVAAGADARPAGALSAGAVVVVAAGHAGALPAGRGRGGADRGRATRRAV